MFTFSLSDFLLKLSPVLTISLAITGTIILVVPDDYIAGLSGIKKTDWLLPATILFWVISATFVAKKLFDKIPEFRNLKKLSLTVDSKFNKPWWAETVQTDGSTTTQIHADITIFNRSDGDFGIPTFRMLRPKLKDESIIFRQIFISAPNGGRYFSSKNPILSGQLSQASITVIVKGKIGKSGKFIDSKFALMDHLGIEHFIKVRLFPLH